MASSAECYEYSETTVKLEFLSRTYRFFKNHNLYFRLNLFGGFAEVNLLTYYGGYFCLSQGF